MIVFVFVGDDYVSMGVDGKYSVIFITIISKKLWDFVIVHLSRPGSVPHILPPSPYPHPTFPSRDQKRKDIDFLWKRFSKIHPISKILPAEDNLFSWYSKILLLRPLKNKTTPLLRPTFVSPKCIFFLL